MFSLLIFSPISEEIKAKEDGCERIKLLQDKINEMRKVYSNLKAEVASIDRKRKRLKKKRGGSFVVVIGAGFAQSFVWGVLEKSLNSIFL